MPLTETANKDVGKLRHYLTIQQVTETQPGRAGAIVKSWTTYANVWGSIKPFQGREYIQAQSVHAELTHRIYCRYLAGVTNKMRVLFGSRIFDIQSIINTDERNVELQLMCTESVR